MVSLVYLHRLLSLLPLQGFHLSVDVHLHLFLNLTRTYWTTRNRDLLVRWWTQTTDSGRVVPPAAKRRRIDEHGTGQPTNKNESAILPTLNEFVCVDPLESVLMDAFWEQMAFRQECSLGTVVAFFVVYIYKCSVLQHADGTTSFQRSTTKLRPKRLELPQGQVVVLTWQPRKSRSSRRDCCNGVFGQRRRDVVLADGLPAGADEALCRWVVRLLRVRMRGIYLRTTSREAWS